MKVDYSVDAVDDPSAKAYDLMIGVPVVATGTTDNTGGTTRIWTPVGCETADTILVAPTSDVNLRGVDYHIVKPTFRVLNIGTAEMVIDLNHISAGTTYAVDGYKGASSPDLDMHVAPGDSVRFVRRESAPFSKWMAMLVPSTSYSPLTANPNYTDFWLGDLGDGTSGGVYDTWTSQILGHVLTGTGTARPAIDAVNGHQALSFDGVDDEMIKASGFDLITGSPTDVYVVAVIEQITGGDTTRCYYRIALSSGNLLLQSNSTYCADKSANIGEPLDTGPVTFESVYTGGQLSAYRDGALISQSTTGGAVVANSSDMRLGAHTFAGRHAKMKIPEIGFQVGSIPSTGVRAAIRAAHYARYGHTGT